MTERKKYLIELFLKKCTLQNINKAHLDFSFSLFKNTYNVSKEKENELKEKYNIEEYIKRLTPLIDEQFTENDLEETVKFYSSEIGKKLIDQSFLLKIGKVSKKMFSQIEQEFALNNEV